MDCRNINQCHRLLAITPSKMKDSTLDEARKVCVEYTVSGLETMTQLSREKGASPFRFLYVSGHKSERDQSKKPWVMGDYLLVRVRVLFPV